MKNELEIRLLKTLHTRIIGQPQRKSIGQLKRCSGFTYCFETNLSRADIDNNWELAETIFSEIIEKIFIMDCKDCKDMEISLDESRCYTFRFTNSLVDLEADAYCCIIRFDDSGNIFEIVPIDISDMDFDNIDADNTNLPIAPNGYDYDI